MSERLIRRAKGFTLIEMILVLVIASFMIYMLIGYMQRRTQRMMIDKTVMQMQQILNAALAYYVVNNQWPDSVACLQGSGCSANPAGNVSTVQYIPAFANITPPFGTAGDQKYPGYQLYSFTNPKAPFTGSPTLSVYNYFTMDNKAEQNAVAAIIAGQLPLGFYNSYQGGHQACFDYATNCGATGTVTIPGQNLNNVPAINYAGIYHNGACVPQPTCPAMPDGKTLLTPQIILIPAQASGVNDQSNPNNLYPLESITAYATVSTPADFTPPACNTDTTSPQSATCYSDTQGTTAITSGAYWRVCLEVITEKGVVNWGKDADGGNWGQYGSVMAITRCAINNEQTGSSFGVWAP